MTEHHSDITADQGFTPVHTPVMFREVLEHLETAPEGVFADFTCGEGGHSELVLSQTDRSVVAFERDPEILARARERLARFGSRITYVNRNFSATGELAPWKGRIAAMLYDFGISSYHYDAAARGFSFKDALLDMRLDPSCDESAADIVNTYDEKELADIFFRYGEERHSRRIARRIVERREREPFVTAGDLASAVLSSLHSKGWHHIHPATRVFQALRIAVNGELDHIERALESSWDYLAPGGVLMAISFHSLEDRIAKTILRAHAAEGRLELVNRKVIIPADDEIHSNPRARSAKLRVARRPA